MARIEKTVFISYRRADVYTALAVYENLKNQGYDVFFDYRSISSGDFEQIITSNIRARAHFVLILTPTALDRCNEPGDWLRREIELAIDEKRNIVPLFFKGFRFGAASKSGVSRWLRGVKPEVLTGKLRHLTRYNGLNVHEDYFEEAMNRLRTEYLNKPLDTVLHPVSMEVRKVVKEEQKAADEALKLREKANGSVKQVGKTPLDEKESPKPVTSTPQTIERSGKRRAPAKIFPYRLEVGLLVFLGLCLWGGISLWNNLSFNTTESTQIPDVIRTHALQPASTNTLSATKTLIPPTPTLGIGSTMIGKDRMTLLYVPAGEFTMGSEDGRDNEKPIHTVYLDAFWIDQTEVTNAMYSECVVDGVCENPRSGGSNTRDFYFRASAFDNYPVIHVSWEDAKTYCEWVDRRLPTEAEWEKAARGDDDRSFPWGNQTPHDGILNYNSNVGDTTEVGTYPDGASPYGALDMAGNVWEWVADWFGETYYASSQDSNPLGSDSGEYRVARGGAWYDDDDSVRSADRGWDNPTDTTNYIGFRCAMDATP
ncbi:MAG: hypothetical protein C3F07_07465 [Anaerolineales bacterium]|nr:MAG: hypothetical protein C3F07_07465 [Anaerolineales bacterium]